MISDIINENIDDFNEGFWLSKESKIKYIDLFKRGSASGGTLGLFFLKDPKAVLNLIDFYKDFKKIIVYDTQGTNEVLKDYADIGAFNDSRVEYFDVGQDIFMKFDKIIMNPPYNLGNKITEAALSVLEDNGECICLQPLSQYKKKDLYRHVDMFELADPSLFEDAVITENLSICSLKKGNVDKYNWMDLVLKSVDQRYIEYYKWNVENYKGIFMKQSNYKPVSYFDTKLDFLETSRCFAAAGGSGFGSNGLGYKWNILHDYSSVNAHNGQIRMPSEQARNNLAIFWYNGKKGESFISKVILGVHLDEASSEYYFAIPQIDWSNIHINQKELWDKGDYDNAVLSEMGLKWNIDKTVIVKDE